jgi:hypothetical protein
MSYILQVDFPYQGPWGSDMEHLMQSLAESIALEKGLIWKIWTENQSENEAGGIYLFTNYVDAQRYLKLHKKRLNESGIQHIRHKIFHVNQKLSQLNRAPIE